MITRNIKCATCGHEGKTESQDTIGVVAEKEIFSYVGKNSSTKFMYFQCPACKKYLTVDPLNVFVPSKNIDIHQLKIVVSEQEKYRRDVALCCGIVYIIFALFILKTFDGWWTYIVCSVLAVLVWISIKTSFPTEKDVKEWNSLESFSEDIKKKFKDKS